MTKTMSHLKVSKTASKGIVMGNARIVKKADLSPCNYKATDIKSEIQKFTDATVVVLKDLEILAQKSDVLAGHIEIMNDPALLAGVTSKVEDGANVEEALFNTSEEFAMIFEMMDDEYMRERSSDIRDVSRRLMANIKGIKDVNLSEITDEVILIAEDLVPSDTASLNLDFILGFITELGGVTSHVSIMARSVSLPALVGVTGILEQTKDDDFVIMDGSTGDIFINPDEETKQKYLELREEFEKKEAMLKEFAHLSAETSDGKSVKICANVGSVTDVENAVKCHIDGVGLFRSEFLYMENTKFPTEDEQFEVYKKAVLTCGNEVIIRTLDIGGDKGLPYFEFPVEENPFLGYRAIRISLELQDVFKAQLRALLRASAFGHIKIMYPMIVSVEELIDANNVLEICKNELKAEGIAFNQDIEVGMMIETPASVMCAENFAKHVKFFSIGTNDLTQYMLCVDRGNKKISNMYNSFNPAVLHAIQKVIDAGHKENIEVGMCGEFASDPRAAKLLLGMGLDEYSVSASEVSNIKYIIRNASYKDCKEIAEKVRDAYTIEQVMEIIK